MTTLVLVVLAGLGLTGVAVLEPELVDRVLHPGVVEPVGPAPAAEPTPGAVLAALTPGGLPTAAGLKTVLDPLVKATVLGDQVGVSVVDVVTGQALYERNSAGLKVPASNTKIVTAAAVLATRGPAYRITTRVVAGPNPGEVVLIGAGDATLSAAAVGYYAGAGRLDQLAAQVKKALGSVKPTKVITDGSLYTGPLLGPAWPSNAPEEGNVSAITALMVNGARVGLKDRATPFDRHRNPERAAGEAFAKLLGLPAGAVAKGRAPADPGTDPASPAPGATATVLPGSQLGAVQSAPLLRQVEQMLTESDNTLAEALARQVALAKQQPASFEGGRVAVQQALTELGLPADQIDLHDGSGFSKQNRLAPAVLTTVLTLAADGRHPQLEGMFNGLPVAGWSGTMLTRFDKSRSGLGVVRAKSGTLEHINALGGVIQTADGRLLAFAVLANNVQVDMITAQDALDKIAAAMATCGCR